ncbi:MAG: prefoldin subunit alpha [Candidatus Micrarchaeota archaeon]|nr:prefoldin subunit alpha [Candidatus Micrarchaeota archaeon]
MAGRDELAKIAYEMQLYREEAQVLQQQLGNLQLNYASVELAIQTLENVAKLSKGDQMLLPIGSGAYIKSKVENNEVALVDVGAGVVVEKPIPDAVKFLKLRMNEMDSMREKLQKNFGEVSNRMKSLEESANKLMEKLKSSQTPKDKEVHQEYR